MKAYRFFIFLSSFVCCNFFTYNLQAQTGLPVDDKKFFADDEVIETTLRTEFRKLLKNKFKDNYQPATIKMRFADSTTAEEAIEIKPRGALRREICRMPPLSLNFSGAVILKKLGRLKLVEGCTPDKYGEQLLLKEYLVYKIYNLLTPKSFRVRLMKVSYEDQDGKRKSFSQYAFLIEDVDEMAKRNKCREWEKQVATEKTNREQMTLVALFQYMIGNTDYVVSENKNIKLIISRNDSLTEPYAVPYDFDYAGLVNAKYAIPHPEFGLSSVRDRLYRGYSRTEEELDAAITVFMANKKNIESEISNCRFLSDADRKEMLEYIDSFYSVIADKKRVRDLFITNARRD